MLLDRYKAYGTKTGREVAFEILERFAKKHGEEKLFEYEKKLNANPSIKKLLDQCGEKGYLFPHHVNFADTVTSIRYFILKSNEAVIAACMVFILRIIKYYEDILFLTIPETSIDNWVFGILRYYKIIS